MDTHSHHTNDHNGSNGQIQADARRRRLGRIIAAQGKIEEDNGRYFVQSQSGAGAYRVVLSPEVFCTCPDFDLRQRPCKHIHAVHFFTGTVAEPVEPTTPSTEPQGTVSRPRPKRPTYPQDWAAYNAAQVNEGRHFARLLSALCNTLTEPPKATAGRPCLPIADVLFSICLRTYYGLPARRAISAIEDAREKGLLSRTPSFASIYQYIENPYLTPLLQHLIERSALPLKAAEVDFAIDSTWLPASPLRDKNRSQAKIRGRDKAKDGAKTGNKEVLVKVHASCGVTTHIITAVEVTPYNSGDARYFIPLLDVTARHFAVREVSADKAYLDKKHFRAADKIGATAYIPFKVNSREIPAKEKPDSWWERAYHYYHLHRDEFLRHYHKRSNIETAFYMVKTKFGRRLRSKTATARVNEVLAKLLCHNICVLVQSMYELGITPEFDM